MDIKTLNLIEEGHRNVAVLIQNDEIAPFNVIEMWVDKTKMAEKFGKEVKYFIENLVKVIDFAIRKKNDVKLCGLVAEPIFINHNDFEPIKNDVEKICLIMAYIEKKLDVKSFFNEFKNKDIYFLGNYPDINAKTGSKFGVKTVKHKSGDFEAIPVFINIENAKKYAKENMPITQTNIKDLCHFWNKFGVVIEPNQKYWIDFSPMELSTI